MGLDEKRRYGESTLSLNREIKRAVDVLTEQNEVSCVRVAAIEKKVNKDPRTVRFHLKLLEQAEYGRFSKDKKLFCSMRIKNK